jgi:hypothetical protein
VQEGRGQVVVCSGEAGIVKSRLAQILTENVERAQRLQNQRLQGEILTACEQLAEAAQTLQASIHLVERLQTPREMRQDHSALEKVLLRPGQAKDAEASLRQACQTMVVSPIEPALLLRTPR